MGTFLAGYGFRVPIESKGILGLQGEGYLSNAGMLKHAVGVNKMRGRRKENMR